MSAAKCRFTPFLYTLCEGMALALKGVSENHDGKGLSVSRGWEEKNCAQRPRVLGVVYKREAKAQGILLNACPWCGEKVRVGE